MPQRDEFTKYVLLAQLETSDVQNPQDLAALWGGISEQCREFGAEVDESYAALGQYDFVVVLDAPDYDACFKCSMVMEREGLDVQTMKVVPTDEFGDLVSDL